MNWIQCNKCSTLKNENPTQSFYVASCFHVFCQLCIQSSCCICKKPFRAVLINHSMPDNVKFYFQDTQLLARNLQKAMKFQIEQRRIYEIQNIHVFDQMIKMTKTKEIILKRRNYLLQELKKETDKVQKLKEKYMEMKMFRQRKSIQRQFMKAAMNERSENTTGYFSNSFNTCSDKSSIYPYSFSPGSRSFTPPILAKGSVKSFSKQSSIHNSGNYDNKEFYVTPRNTFITKHLHQATRNSSNNIPLQNRNYHAQLLSSRNNFFTQNIRSSQKTANSSKSMPYRHKNFDI